MLLLALLTACSSATGGGELAPASTVPVPVASITVPTQHNSGNNDGLPATTTTAQAEPTAAELWQAYLQL